MYLITQSSNKNFALADGILIENLKEAREAASLRAAADQAAWYVFEVTAKLLYSWRPAGAMEKDHTA